MAEKRISVLELGIEPYGRVWELQHRLVQARRAERSGDVLILLEHQPVLTLGRRATESNILVSPERLAELGVQVRRVERGGDVTYHGPGQLVGYPILRILDYGLGVSDYMHALEEVIIRALSEFDITAQRKEGFIGVWTESGKIAALGVRLEEGVSYHGFALNVNTLMEHFALIVPCGLRDEAVISMQQILGYPAEMAAVRAGIRRHFAAVFGATLDEFE
jgi:lipoate-protein ligase B